MNTTKITLRDRKNAIITQYIKGLVSHKYTLAQASQSTGYSVQWLCKLKKKYLADKNNFLVHGNKNKTPINKTPEELVQKIIAIYALEEYKDVNFLYFCECLEEYHNIKISYNTLRGILRRAGIRSPEAHKIKRKKTVHRPRIRRANEGDLLQFDGTPYEWFKKFGDNHKYCMHGSIDDATGKVTALYIAQNECVYGIMELIKQTKNRYGLPREIYMDRAAWACVTPRHKNCLSLTEQLAGIHEKRTQLQRILSELNINQILAWSPQAKGRVERMWGTIQKRYPLWAYKHGIKTMEEANKHMNEFINYFNKHFAAEAKSKEIYWLEAPEDFEDIMFCQYTHKTNVNGCFKFHSYNFAVIECPFVANKTFTLCLSANGLFARMPDNKYYPVKLLDDDNLGYTISDTMPEVVKQIIEQNLFSFAKEVSA